LEIDWEGFEEQAIQTEEGRLFNICQPQEKIERYMTRQIQPLFPGQADGKARVLFKKSSVRFSEIARRRWSGCSRSPVQSPGRRFARRATCLIEL
jgi:hypothetical protein